MFCKGLIPSPSYARRQARKRASMLSSWLQRIAFNNTYSEESRIFGLGARAVAFRCDLCVAITDAAGGVDSLQKAVATSALAETHTLPGSASKHLPATKAKFLSDLLFRPAVVLELFVSSLSKDSGAPRMAFSAFARRCVVAGVCVRHRNFCYRARKSAIQAVSIRNTIRCVFKTAQLDSDSGGGVACPGTSSGLRPFIIPPSEDLEKSSLG